MADRYVDWTQARFNRLCREYDRALENGRDRFTLENLDENGDAEFIVSFAKYLIEYLEGRGLTRPKGGNHGRRR